MSVLYWLTTGTFAAATLAVAVRAWGRTSRPLGLLLAGLWLTSQAIIGLCVPGALTLLMWGDFYAALALLWLSTRALRAPPSLNDVRFQLVILLFAQVAAHFVFEARRDTAGAWWWCQLELNATFALMLAVTEWRPRLGDWLRDAPGAVAARLARARVRHRVRVRQAARASARRGGASTLRPRA